MKTEVKKIELFSQIKWQVPREDGCYYDYMGIPYESNIVTGSLIIDGKKKIVVVTREIILAIINSQDPAL